MKVEYSCYELQQKSALNRLDLSTQREGCVIRMTHEGRIGYGVIHPWSELGDPSLADCIHQIQRPSIDEVHGLVSQALQSAQVYTQGSGFSIPPGNQLRNHATLPRLTGSAVQRAVEAGFTTIKVKRGKDWMRLRRKTASIIAAFPQLHWRFDFNGALQTHRELHQFIAMLQTDQIDFIEDPFSTPQLAESWRGVPIGHDRIIPNALHLEQNYLIAKPALQSLDQIQDLAEEAPHKVVFTSYMDHPLGQLFAQAQASQFYQQNQVETPPYCGLVTQDLYESTAYSTLLGTAKPILPVPAQKELEHLLAQEKWSNNKLLIKN